ncbi:hypothetical protein JXM83_03215 [Candidatus Woesearchaeota archaeon]|nr:hypothetical protein [Candidatus Woesearchaeota archaeon]
MKILTFETKRDLISELKGNISDFFIFNKKFEGIKVRAFKRSSKENTTYLQIPRKLRPQEELYAKYYVVGKYLIVEVE